MRVLIVGGGIAGLTLGAFLRDSDIDYEIIDKVPDWSHGGFLIAIWDSGRDILKKIALADAFDEKSSRMERLVMRDGQGRLVRTHELAHLFPEYGSVVSVIARADLHEMLRTKIDPVRIHTDTSLTSLTQDVDAVHATLSTGETKSYDLVVGADGIHSLVRNTFFKQYVERFENWRMWFLWVDKKFALPHGIVAFVEPGEFATVFSCGDRSMIWMAAPADHATRDDAATRLERLKSIFRDEKALMPDVLAHVKPEDVMLSDLVHLKMKRLSEGRAVLIGDAGHNFGPHAGIGGTMAMEDAYTLAGEIMRVSNVYPLQHALETYEKQRKHRINAAEQINKNVRSISFVRSPFLRKLINRIVHIAPGRFTDQGFGKLLREEI